MEFIGKCLLVGVGGKKILAVGDLHFGFEEFLNRAGVFVLRKMFEEAISYFDRVFEKIGRVEEIVLLGDVKHNFGKIMGQEWGDIFGLLDYLERWCDKVVVIQGNHDKILKPIVKDRKNVELKDFYCVGEFCFLHGDRDFVECWDKEIKSWVVGHGHPAVKIKERHGAKVEKYKCFLVGKFKGKNVVVMPSFFEGNLGSDVRENELGLTWDLKLGNFQVQVVGEDLGVLDFGKLKEL